MKELAFLTSVWDALEDTPEGARQNAPSRRLDGRLKDAIDNWRDTPVAAAARLGIDAACLDNLKRGHISHFNLDDLVGLAKRANTRIEDKAAEQFCAFCDIR